jgi:hypothetical protein
MTMSESVRSSPWWGVVKSLGYYRRGPVVLLHTQKVGIKYKKPTCVWQASIIEADILEFMVSALRQKWDTDLDINSNYKIELSIWLSSRAKPVHKLERAALAT